MDFELFRRQVPTEVFDYPLLHNFLRDFKSPRDKVAALIAQGKIVRLKKGLYIFGENWRRNPIALEMIANLLYGPSCISFEYALAHYGLMLERPTVITSLSIGDTKTFHTPLGTFEYRAIDREKFKVGIEYVDLGKEGGYFIACKEKALADLVYRTAGIRTMKQLSYYLFEEMRIDETALRELDRKKVHLLSKAYGKKSVSLLEKL